MKMAISMAGVVRMPMTVVRVMRTMWTSTVSGSTVNILSTNPLSALTELATGVERRT